MLAGSCFADLAHLSLEDPDTRIFPVEDPRGFLSPLATGAILDEIQRTPELVSYIQTLVDENSQPGRSEICRTGADAQRLAGLFLATLTIASFIGLITRRPATLNHTASASNQYSGLGF